MSRNEKLLEYLKTRRSVPIAFLGDPGPSDAELHELLAIGARVPDHGKLTPWRTIVIAGDARAKAGERLAQIAKSKSPEMDEAALENERKRFLPAPLTIGVISKAAPHPKIPEFEQLLSAANVTFNLMNGAFALGYAANWVTRWFTFDDEAARMLGAGPGERFVGFIHIGTATARIEDRPRPEVKDIVTYWPG